MPKYSFKFKKKVVEAYLRGEGGYSYLAKKYVELLVLHTLLVQILIHALLICRLTIDTERSKSSRETVINSV